MRSRKDNSGTIHPARATIPPDNRVRRVSARDAASYELLRPLSHFLAQFIERSGVRFRSSAQHHVDSWEYGQDMYPNELTQPSFHFVAIDRTVSVLRHDDADTATCGIAPGAVRMYTKGSDSGNAKGSVRAHVHGGCAHPLPFPANLLDFRSPCYPIGSGKPVRPCVRLRWRRVRRYSRRHYRVGRHVVRQCCTCSE